MSIIDGLAVDPWSFDERAFANNGNATNAIYSSMWSASYNGAYGIGLLTLTLICIPRRMKGIVTNSWGQSRCLKSESTHYIFFIIYIIRVPLFKFGVNGSKLGG